jgi:DNA-binding HxlR family transcriptional regulator
MAVAAILSTLSAMKLVANHAICAIVSRHAGKRKASKAEAAPRLKRPAINQRFEESRLMSSKETAAIGQLLGLLESRYAIRVLWALKDGHAQTFRLLQDSVGGITPNTLNTRIKELREAGLLTHGTDGYAVTTSGADLLKRLGDLSAFAAKWAASQARKAT